MKYDPVVERRLRNALLARDRAQNPAFKALWNKVFDQVFLNAAQLMYKQYRMNYDAIFKLIADVGFPIAAALLGGVFVYFVINYILESVVKAIKGMQGIIMGLDNRVKTMNHDIIRVDAVVSSALGLKPDLDRLARADGKNDARRD